LIIRVIPSTWPLIILIVETMERLKGKKIEAKVVALTQFAFHKKKWSIALDLNGFL